MHSKALFALAAAATVLGSLAGCDITPDGSPSDFAKPTIAVMKFQNRASFMGWNLGDGMADQLVDSLVSTRRYHVIERPEVDALLKELRFQHSGATRDQNKAELGQLKNVQYLIKGTVTDFGHVANTRGFFDGSGWNIFGGSAQAVMGMTLYVVDVQSGEIISSESIQESASANDVAVQGTYKGMAFGGQTFYRTPLGKATRHVIDKAVKRITDTIAAQPWTAKIASIGQDGSIIINGGQDRQLSVGAEYEVVQAGSAIVDPDSGDILGQHAGKVLGRVRISQVQPRFSVARTTLGKPTDFQVGMRCRRAAPLALRPT